MQAGSAAKIEKTMDRAASALFGCAAAYAAFMGFARGSAGSIAAAEAAAAGMLAFFLTGRALAAVHPEAAKLPVPVFDVRQIDPVEAPHSPESAELLLTDRYEAPAAAQETLMLDDVLAQLEPDSRVVRLFDPAAMPTPGQLNDRIERHLVRDAPPGSSHDASQALHDALAQLRRSLR